MKLTNKFVELLEYKGHQTASGSWSAHYEWDSLPGFGVRVLPSGLRTFVLKYRNAHGKQRYHRIGRFPEVSASAARKEAEQLRAIISSGGDPQADRQSRRQVFTFGDLGAEYISKYSKSRKKTWRTDERRLERHIYPRWRNLPVPELTKPMVAKMHREIADGVNLDSKGGEVEANRVVQLVRAIISWALDRELIPPMKNPAAKIEPFQEASRRRWVRPFEMRWLLAALEEQDDPFSSGVVRLILRTGVRKSEAFGLRWSDVDFAGRELTFRDTKNGTDHTLPMTADVELLLENIPRVEGNPFVFPGRVDGQPLTRIKKSWNTTRSRAGELAREAEHEEVDLSDVTLHDLRRTVGAWLASAGNSELLIARVLNHKVESVTGIYARLDDLAVRKALEQFESALHASREPTKIIPFERFQSS